jgi:hypothetical protein
MSALLPKADIAERGGNVRLLPVNAASRRRESRSNPHVPSRETRSIHTKVKATTTILWSAFYCQ